MNIKEQIDQLILEYRDDFYNKTGLKLICGVDNRNETISLSRLAELICAYFHVPIECCSKNYSKNEEAADVKKFFIYISCYKGYKMKKIANYMGFSLEYVNRIHSLCNNLIKKGGYKQEYESIKAFIEANKNSDIKAPVLVEEVAKPITAKEYIINIIKDSGDIGIHRLELMRTLVNKRLAKNMNSAGVALTTFKQKNLIKEENKLITIV